MTASSQGDIRASATIRSSTATGAQRDGASRLDLSSTLLTHRPPRRFRCLQRISGCVRILARDQHEGRVGLGTNWPVDLDFAVTCLALGVLSSGISVDVL